MESQEIVIKRHAIGVLILTDDQSRDGCLIIHNQAGEVVATFSDAKLAVRFFMAACAKAEAEQRKLETEVMIDELKEQVFAINSGQMGLLNSPVTKI